MKHFQTHKPTRFFFPKLLTSDLTILRPHTSEPVKESCMLSVDQFFAESHNRINGFVSTSPTMYDDPQAASHMAPVAAERPLSSKLSDEDIHNMVVSRKIQSRAELSELTRLRPQEDDFKPVDSTPVDPVPTSVDPAPSE